MSIDEVISRSPFLHTIVFSAMGALLAAATVWLWTTSTPPTTAVRAVQLYGFPFYSSVIFYLGWSVTRPNEPSGRHVAERA